MPNVSKCKQDGSLLDLSTLTWAQADKYYHQIGALEKRLVLSLSITKHQSQTTDRIFPTHESLTSSIIFEARKRNQCFLVAISKCSATATTETEELVMGYLLYERRTLVCHIHRLAVEESYRRQGIGKQLIQFCIDHIRHCSKISLCTLYVDVDREAALALYTKTFHFVIQSRRKDFYQLGRDAYHMELDLDVHQG